jgi:hypothetical protein
MAPTKQAIGQTIIIYVESVRVENSGKWPDYIWTGLVNGDRLELSTPKAATDRQMEKRLQLTLHQLPGNWIQIERAPNKEDSSKSWWNFDVASPASLPPVSKRITPPSHAEAKGNLPGDPASAYRRDDEDIPLPPDPNEAIEHHDAPVGAVTEASVTELYFSLMEKAIVFAKAMDVPVRVDANAVAYSLHGILRNAGLRS